MRVLLLLPPMTQLNAPYPSTAFLTGFLDSRGIDVRQDDLAIRLVDRLFSRDGLRAMHTVMRGDSDAVSHFRRHLDWIAATIAPVMAFLRGGDPTLAHRIVSRGFLPEGPRFHAQTGSGANADEVLQWAFGALGVQDHARHLATLYLEDVADAIHEGVDTRFELSRYAERLALCAPSFSPLAEALEGDPSPLDAMLDALTLEALERHDPGFVGVTAPFPGNVYGAFRIAQVIRRARPGVPLALGGGYPSTELRELAEPRVFDTFDYVTLDAGEHAMLRLLDHAAGRIADSGLVRTFVRREGKVCFFDDPTAAPIPHDACGGPTYRGLPLDLYVSVLDLLNPMHRIWSDGCWNKLLLAHGCYWRKCAFCDTRLDYIARYSAASADQLVDHMEALIHETGQSGFHFVDEAAPPALLRRLSERLIARGVTASWWVNVRIDPAFTPEVCRLLSRAGCIAVTVGLETAQDRLLQLMHKGATVAQTACVARSFTDAGIMVHAYLMYGFPSQTSQETVNALEIVRQLFAEGCLQSAFWHRFALTVHSGIMADPARFGILPVPGPSTFAVNEVPFEDPSGCDHESLGYGLRKGVYNFMHGIGLEEDVRAWFDVDVPRATVPRSAIRRALRGDPAGEPAGRPAGTPAGKPATGPSRRRRRKP